MIQVPAPSHDLETVKRHVSSDEQVAYRTARPTIVKIRRQDFALLVGQQQFVALSAFVGHSDRDISRAISGKCCT